MDGSENDIDLDDGDDVTEGSDDRMDVVSPSAQDTVYHAYATGSAWAWLPDLLDERPLPFGGPRRTSANRQAARVHSALCAAGAAANNNATKTNDDDDGVVDGRAAPLDTRQIRSTFCRLATAGAPRTSTHADGNAVSDLSGSVPRQRFDSIDG